MKIHFQPFVPLLVYFLAVVALVGGILALSYLLGPRHRERYTGVPYEGGMPLTGTARLRLSIKFYLIAMFFVIFDLESIFVFAWAVSARRTGLSAYIEVLIFIVVLVVALIYLWRLGALDWGTLTKRNPLAGRMGGRSHARMAE